MKKYKEIGSVAAAMGFGLGLMSAGVQAQQSDSSSATPESYWAGDSTQSSPKSAKSEAAPAAVAPDQPEASAPPAEPVATEQAQAPEAAPEAPVESSSATQNPEPQPVDQAPVEQAAVSEPTEPVASDAASDATPSSSWFSDMNFSWGGFVRVESAAALTGEDNPNNQHGNVFNGRSIARTSYTPPALLAPVPATWSTLPVPTLLATNADAPGVRVTSTDSTPFNYGIARVELEGGLTLTPELKVVGRLRGIYDLGLTQGYNGNDYDKFQSGIAGGDPGLYRGKVNHLQYRVQGNSSPNPLEWAGRDYQVYFPALFVQYNHGPLDIRVGNQQIAWGQAIFFRVLDVPNGLDLRRHSVLDYAQEEYSDKRVPSLAARISYQMTDDVLVDGYVQKFQPTILGNPNTSYNVIPSQFTVHDMYSAEGYDKKVSYGIRMKANIEQYGFQLMAARRYNPDGVYRWTESGVNRNLPNDPLSLGALVNAAYAVYPGRKYGSTGEALSHTPFEVAPNGVYSADEWFYYAADARLDSLKGLNTTINEFPASQDLFATPVDNTQDAAHLLNTFFTAAGGSLRGHIAREYFAENNYGLGLSYIVDSTPGSILDQLIINVESLYTPKRHYTNPSLSHDFLVQDSSVSALVLEKYHRFFQSIPATYIVLQYMYRNADDMVGRSLKGYGGSGVDANGIPTPATGVNNAQYVALAFQQPLPQDIFRIGFAALYDVRGGVLVQPGVKWKPNGDVTVEGFFSYLNGSLGGNRNNNLISSLDYAKEFTLRLSYQF